MFKDLLPLPLQTPERPVSLPDDSFLCQKNAASLVEKDTHFHTVSYTSVVRAFGESCSEVSEVLSSSPHKKEHLSF